MVISSVITIELPDGTPFLDIPRSAAPVVRGYITIMHHNTMVQGAHIPTNMKGLVRRHEYVTSGLPRKMVRIPFDPIKEKNTESHETIMKNTMKSKNTQLKSHDIMTSAWWFQPTPLKNVSSSMGRINYPIYEMEQ